MAIYRPPSSSLTDFTSVGAGGGGDGFTSAAESLLERKAQNQRAAAKARKKDERRMLALSLLGLGSTIYNNQVQKRTKEILKRKEFNLANAKDEANKINAVARLGQNLVGPDGVQYATVEELKKQDMGKYNLAKSNYYGVAEAQLKKLYGTQWDEWKDSRTVRRLVEEGADGALKYLLDDGNLKSFYTSLQNITPDNREATLAELSDKYANITEAQYSRELGDIFDGKIQEFQNQRNIFSPTNFKNLLNQFGTSFETKGKPNIWKNVTDKDIIGPSVNEIFDAVKIGENLVPKIDEAISQIPRIDYTTWAFSEKGSATRTLLEQYSFTENDIDNKRQMGLYDKQFVFKEDLEYIMNEMSDADKNKAKDDAVALSERLYREYDFAKDFYLGVAQQEALKSGLKPNTSQFGAYVDEATSRFAKAMQDSDPTRLRVAYAAILRAGGEDADLNWSLGRADVRYNPLKAQALLKSPFTFDKTRGNFVAEQGYLASKDETKQKLYMTQLHSIFQSKNLDEGEKLELADMFMGAIPSPFGDKNKMEIIDVYQNNFLPAFKNRYNDPDLYNNINRGLLLGELLAEKQF